MGTVGKYLQDARVARGIDLREAAQQTRISARYLKALEAEDFSKLPGEVFVKGFLKSYGKFLRLPESEIMERYAQIQQKRVSVVPPAPAATTAAVEEVSHAPSKFPLEPVLWTAGIVVVLVLFLFAAFPRRHHVKEAHEGSLTSAGSGELYSVPIPTSVPEKLYLKVVALKDTWLLIRTDASPEKKAMLNKGESLIWSANERFLLSYGSAGALKLVLNGKELTVDEPNNAEVRDLTIVSSGVVNRKIKGNNSAESKPKLKSVSNIKSSRSTTAPFQMEQPQPASAQTKTSAQKLPKQVQ